MLSQSPYLTKDTLNAPQPSVSAAAAGWVLALGLCFIFWVWVFRAVYAVIAP